MAFLDEPLASPCHTVAELSPRGIRCAAKLIAGDARCVISTSRVILLQTPNFFGAVVRMKINFSRPPFAIIALCLIAFCLAVFYPALSNEFVWDDTIFLVRSSAYSGANRIAASLLEPFALFGAYYRPLIALSFALIPAGGNMRRRAQKVRADRKSVV